MNFQSDYKKLLAYAKKVCRQKKLRTDPAELINQVYLLFADKNIEYDYNLFKSKICGEGWDAFSREAAHISIDRQWERETIEETRVCATCKEDKPIMCFSPDYFRMDKHYWHRTYSCIECENKRKQQYYNRDEQREYMAEWYEKNREKWNAYVRNTRVKKNTEAKPIQELWKKANRKYQEKQKELLTDVYVKGILKALGDKNPTPEQIQEKRKSLIEKRKREEQSPEIFELIKEVNKFKKQIKIVQEMVKEETTDIEALINKQKERDKQPYIFKNDFSDIA